MKIIRRIKEFLFDKVKKNRGALVSEKKSLNDRLATLMENKLKKPKEEPVELDEPIYLKEGVKKIEETPVPDDDEEIVYVKDGIIRKTNLYTKDEEEFKAWVAFTHPSLMHYPKDLETLITNMSLRKQLFTIMQNGVGIGRQFRDPTKGLPPLNNYNGKGH